MVLDFDGLRFWEQPQVGQKRPSESFSLKETVSKALEYGVGFYKKKVYQQKNTISKLLRDYNQVLIELEAFSDGFDASEFSSKLKNPMNNELSYIKE